MLFHRSLDIFIQDLTYKIINFTNDGIPYEKQREIFRGALNKWQEVSSLRITEVDSTDADILISFVTKDHGDGYPFDDQGGTLAHAFYPHNNLGEVFFIFLKIALFFSTFPRLYEKFYQCN